jgi:hypothetical protein
VAWLAVAAFTWWVGFEGGAQGASAVQVTAAVAAGLSIAIVLTLVESVASSFAAAVAGAMVMALPAFVPVHHVGLAPAGLLLLTLVMLVAMVHAPRWSLAHGTLGGAAAVFVAPAAIGLPIAAIAWAAMPHQANGTGRQTRILLALVPVLLMVVLGKVVGNAWPADGGLGWHGGLDRSIAAAGTIIGDQLAPGISSPAVRFFTIADLSLVLVAVVVMAWRRQVRMVPPDAPVRRWYRAAGTMGIAITVGLATRHLLVRDTPAPDQVAILPLAVLGLLATVVSISGFWRSWPRWAKVLTSVILLGWLQAAVRG